MFLTMGYGVYFFFASLMLLSIPFVYFLIPETKSIPLERMDDLFEIKDVRQAHGLMMERLRIEEEDFRHNAEGADISMTKMKNDDEKNETV